MGQINIGRFVNIFGPGTIISSIKSNIYIGDFVSIGQNVSIQDSNHRLDRASTTFAARDIYGGSVMDDVTSKGDIIIEEDVWIGSNSVILSGVTIGRGAVIAAGSVVTKNVGKYEIVGGNPAKYIKSRFSDTTIERLESEQWWNWSKEKILSSQKFFLEKIE
ncbi:CatB-related O-acetyltransferase [Vibrio sp. 05-20-BW147]|uniref:CatB-related O-acetyltransferase n=1 Tax=Vibrio sp. 05-20-BW147 TaxID=2575834 RepID=UPI001593A77D|nr:CatB-related O-acetyltransferase [Vibrio sp. 05-20-BW147]NVC64580.1 CatB-related O-acetyltransferase [Vibrio sp. 05-20-BW147]